MVIDDFNGDNFDHGKEGFVGGGGISVSSTGGRPIEFRPVPIGTPPWGRNGSARSSATTTIRSPSEIRAA
jgi:gluconate 2-dehydrogenase alpha chain